MSGPIRKSSKNDNDDNDQPSCSHSLVNAAQPSCERTKRGISEMEDGEFTQEQLSRMSRSERKKHREKRRRNDVNKGFEDLMALLLEIDPGVQAEAEDRSRRGQLKSSHDDNLILSRVELIGRTVEVLRRVHNENEERKVIIEQLVQSMSNSSQQNFRSSMASGSQQLQHQPRVSLPVLPSVSSEAAAPRSSMLPILFNQQHRESSNTNAFAQQLDSELVQRILLSSNRRQSGASPQSESFQFNSLSNANVLRQQILGSSNFMNPTNSVAPAVSNQAAALREIQRQIEGGLHTSQVEQLHQLLRLYSARDGDQSQQNQPANSGNYQRF